LGGRAGEKKPADGTKALKQPEPLNLEKFKDDPAKGAAPVLRLRSRVKVKPVLASPDFDAGIRKLALAATAEPKAAVALSKFVLHPEFLNAAAAALKAASAWPEPSEFKSADDRKLAAGALARSRPSWASAWLSKALVETQARFAAMRHFLASRLILASGGLMGAVEALGRDLLLDDKIIGLVTALDADAGAKLREDAAKLKQDKVVNSPVSVSESPPREVVVPLDQAAIMREAAWSDADEALGRALRDIGFMARSFEQLESAAEGESMERVRRAKGASEIVLKWVRQAARQRSIRPLNSVGERVQFDPVYHDMDDDASPGVYVRVVTPSIVRGDGDQQIVLLRGEVELD
jgi:hypothetical protein